MNLARLLSLGLVVPALSLVAVGCASNTEDDSASGEDAVTASAGLNAELGGAVGALVVNGQKLCTAALVNANAGATVRINGAEVSAQGRTVAFGGACVGKLSSSQGDFRGAAAFVSIKNGVTLKTPIVGFDFESQASAGIAIGYLGAASQATPIDFVGVAAQADVGAHGGAFVKADGSGLAVGADFEVHGGFDVAIGTQCAQFRAGASASVGAGAGFALRGGDDAAAIIRVGGHLKFAAYLDVKVDGQCVVSHTVEAINNFTDRANSAGVADIVSMQYHPGTGSAKMSIYLKDQPNFIRINSAGGINAEVNGIKCHKLPITGAPCQLYKDGGFAPGWYTINVDLGFQLLPHQNGQLVVFSQTDSPFENGGSSDTHDSTFGGG